jgi:Holliday junction resolvase RusA-like endonuclease
MTGPRKVRFEVRGTPAPQGSKNIGRHGNLYESSREVGPWRDAVRDTAFYAMRGRPFTGPVFVVLAFRLKRPKNTPLRVLFEAKRPDLDKYVRSTFDGLTAGQAWNDDSQAVGLVTWKFYADWTGCAVTLTDAQPDPDSWPGWIPAQW